MVLFMGLALMMAPAQSATTMPQPAAPAAPAAAPDPARLTAARTLVMVTDPARQLDRNLDAMRDLTVQQMLPALERQMGRPPSDSDRQRLAAAFRADMAEMYARIWPGMIQGMVEGYASLFTVAELQRMTELMRDPLMQRMFEAVPQLTQRMFDRVNIADNMPRMARMTQVLEELVPRNTQSSTTTTVTTTTTDRRQKAGAEEACCSGVFRRRRSSFAIHRRLIDQDAVKGPDAVQTACSQKVDGAAPCVA